MNIAPKTCIFCTSAETYRDTCPNCGGPTVFFDSVEYFKKIASDEFYRHFSLNIDEGEQNIPLLGETFYYKNGEYSFLDHRPASVEKTDHPELIAVKCLSVVTGKLNQFVMHKAEFFNIRTAADMKIEEVRNTSLPGFRSNSYECLEMEKNCGHDECSKCAFGEDCINGAYGDIVKIFGHCMPDKRKDGKSTYFRFLPCI